MEKSAFITHLKSLVGEGLVEDALDLLEQHVSDFASYCANDIFMLKSRLQNAKKQLHVYGTINKEDYDLTIAKVNLAILEIANYIQKRDENHNSRRRGYLMHQIPLNMPLKKEIKCVIRIAYLMNQLLYKLTIDNDTVFQEVQVAQVMSIELIDENEIKVFEVRASTEEEQFIIYEDYTEWIFKVVPLRTGRFPLLLRIGAMEVINGRERKREVLPKNWTVK